MSQCLNCIFNVVLVQPVLNTLHQTCQHLGESEGERREESWETGIVWNVKKVLPPLFLKMGGGAVGAMKGSYVCGGCVMMSA